MKGDSGVKGEPVSLNTVYIFYKVFSISVIECYCMSKCTCSLHSSYVFCTG